MLTKEMFEKLYLQQLKTIKMAYKMLINIYKKKPKCELNTKKYPM